MLEAWLKGMLQQRALMEYCETMTALAFADSCDSDLFYDSGYDNDGYALALLGQRWWKADDQCRHTKISATVKISTIDVLWLSLDLASVIFRMGTYAFACRLRLSSKTTTSSRSTTRTTRRVDQAPGTCHRHHRAPRVVFAGRSPTVDRKVFET